ncbi:MAG TPA: hypothetical protein VKH15_12165 [Candidatus Acidoferrum sp.]|nr:hypothetical protein [Candidatus Acidoferrum sp.]
MNKIFALAASSRAAGNAAVGHIRDGGKRVEAGLVRHVIAAFEKVPLHIQHAPAAGLA